MGERPGCWALVGAFLTFEGYAWRRTTPSKHSSGPALLRGGAGFAQRAVGAVRRMDSRLFDRR
jgi:hypothetical protein